MGPTHSLSAVAIFLILLALFPAFLFDKLLKTQDIFVVLASIFIASGSALLPDLDNSKSTAKSTLGLLGTGLSWLMRTVALGVYHLTKTKYDNQDDNDPHRKFWHTLVSVFVIWLIVYSTVSINKEILLPSPINKKVTIGFLFGMLWVYSSLRLSLSGLFGYKVKKIQNKSAASSLMLTLVSLAVTVAILVLSPKDISYTWVAYVYGLGYLTHLLGDTLTRAGTPLLFPIKVKGKRWYNIRVVGMKAGGSTEKNVVIPLLIVIIIACIIRIGLFMIKVR